MTQTESGICLNRGSSRESNLYRSITDSEKFERVLDQVTHVFDLAEKHDVLGSLTFSNKKSVGMTSHTDATTFLFSREKYRGSKLRDSEVD